jgi:hypothetical protein
LNAANIVGRFWRSLRAFWTGRDDGGPEHVALRAIALDRVPNCESGFPFRAVGDHEKHPKLFVQIVPRVSDLTDSSNVGSVTRPCAIAAKWRIYRANRNALRDGFRITAAIRERVHGATTFAANASCLGSSALERLDGEQSSLTTTRRSG